jgi:hypothetical protein
MMGGSAKELEADKLAKSWGFPPPSHHTEAIDQQRRAERSLPNRPKKSK